MTTTAEQRRAEKQQLTAALRLARRTQRENAAVLQQLYRNSVRGRRS